MKGLEQMDYICSDALQKDLFPAPVAGFQLACDWPAAELFQERVFTKAAQ